LASAGHFPEKNLAEQSAPIRRRRRPLGQWHFNTRRHKNRSKFMKLHLIVYVYMALSAAYFEATLECLIENRRHRVVREMLLACLYGSIATLMLLDPTLLHLAPAAT
jgi:hypothetical protein